MSRKAHQLWTGGALTPPKIRESLTVCTCLSSESALNAIEVGGCSCLAEHYWPAGYTVSYRVVDKAVETAGIWYNMVPLQEHGGACRLVVNSRK